MEAHDAGADVSTAYRLAIAYLGRALGMHLPGKIDSWLSPTMKSGQTGWKIFDEEANDFLTRLYEAGVGNDQTDEVMNDGEERLTCASSNFLAMAKMRNSEIAIRTAEILATTSTTLGMTSMIKRNWRLRQ